MVGMRPHLVGLMVALVLCANHVQGLDGDIVDRRHSSTRTSFERHPHQVPSSRDQDAVERTPSTPPADGHRTHSPLYNSTSLGGGGSGNRRALQSSAVSIGGRNTANDVSIDDGVVHRTADGRDRISGMATAFGGDVESVDGRDEVSEESVVRALTARSTDTGLDLVDEEVANVSTEESEVPVRQHAVVGALKLNLPPAGDSGSGDAVVASISLEQSDMNSATRNASVGGNASADVNARRGYLDASEDRRTGGRASLNNVHDAIASRAEKTKLVNESERTSFSVDGVKDKRINIISDEDRGVRDSAGNRVIDKASKENSFHFDSREDRVMSLVKSKDTELNSRQGRITSFNNSKDGSLPYDLIEQRNASSNASKDSRVSLNSSESSASMIASPARGLSVDSAEKRIALFAMRKEGSAASGSTEDRMASSNVSAERVVELASSESPRGETIASTPHDYYDDEEAALATSTARSGEALEALARRRQRQATAQEEAAEMVPACRKFVEGNPDRREFHSPNFPGNYPNNTDCVKVLAAEPGHLLRLDFRDSFHVEPSEGCRFDYLEVRDGAHGYENLIGTFCGREFPPMMTSSGRHLWLRFHSDENIEYAGFTAVYESIPKPTTEMDTYELPDCVIEVGGSEGFLNTTADIEAERRRIVAHYALKLECMWIIRVKPGWRIQLSFLKFELAKPNDCVSNFVDVFSDRTDLPSRLKSFCGSIADMVTSKSHVLHVRFLAEAKAINSTFVALFTAFRDSKLSGSLCTKDEFDCQDETCISKNLRCNDRINCRFRWDEDECSTKISPMEKILRSDHIIIILVVFSLIMFGMCFAFVFNCVRKLMHDHKVIQENFRMSREGRLDEVGIKLPSPREPSVATSSIVSRRPSPTPGATNPECYVPGALLPILVGPPNTVDHASRPSNGDAVFVRRDANLSDDDDDDDDDDMLGFPAPEMRDNECQTRESLFHSHSDRSATPPPPPPPPSATSRHHHHHHHHHPDQQPVGQFSTFGYTRDNRREDRAKEAAPPPRRPTAPTTPTGESQRFRAEAVIEMEGRAFSVDSTKSAPDVIVTH